MKPRLPYDEARIGLVREILEIVLGLEKETEDRVMHLIRGSIDSQDVRTPEIRARIGHRAMKYLTNAIDLARSEGAEIHDEPDVDITKLQRGDIEPGHKHHIHFNDENENKNEMKESFTFKSFLLNEIETMIDTSDPDAVAQLRRDQRMAQQSPERLAAKEISRAQDEAKQARQAMSPTASIETMIARKKQELMQLQKRLAAMRSNQGQQQQQQQQPTGM